MNDDASTSQNKQTFILILLIVALVVSGIWIYKKTNESARQAILAKLNLEFSQLVSTAWTLNDVQVFLESLPQSELKELGDMTGKSGATPEQLANHLMWLSNSSFTYPFKDKNEVSYHTDILLWAAQKNGVAASVVLRACENIASLLRTPLCGCGSVAPRENFGHLTRQTPLFSRSAPCLARKSTPSRLPSIFSQALSSFQVERRLFEKKFAQTWDHLNPQQRTELLKHMNVSGFSDSQKAALIAGTGAAAVTALSATVALSGFAFYTTMSTAIAASAGLLGVTLPFSVYAGASSTVAVLSGPIGWSIALVAGTGAAIGAAASNVEKTTEFILALHSYKARRAEEIAKKIQNLGGIVKGKIGTDLFSTL